MNENDWDKILKIRTTGRDDSNSDTYRYPYEPTSYDVLERLIRSGYIDKQNTVLDYGCGKGRVSLFLSFQTKCHSIGIEYDERIFERAIANKESCSSGNRVQFVCSDAKVYDIPSEVDRIFFFNPFSVILLRSILKKIYESYYESPRRILLMFYYPSTEYIECLMNESRLTLVDEVDCSDLFKGSDERERIVVFSTD